MRRLAAHRAEVQQRPAAGPASARRRRCGHARAGHERAEADRAAAVRPVHDQYAAQLVYVSVARQHLWMCAGHTVVRDDPVTTGMVGEYTNTPTGTYEIQGRTPTRR